MRPWHWKVLAGVAAVWCVVGAFRLLGYRVSWYSESMPGGIYRLVDGVFWAHWTLLDGVPKLADCAVLEDGLVWLYAPNPRSWDSRYYGAVDREALVSAAVRTL